MSNLRELKELQLKGKKIFLRVDFNVPMEDGKVSDNTRIKEALPTINYILQNGGHLSIFTHFGRPKGERNMKYSIKPVVDYINSMNFFSATYIDDCIGEKKLNALKLQKNTEVLMLENLRFYTGEEKNDPNFVKSLSEGYDIYVNDAFGACHRKHASIYGVPQTFGKSALAGFLIKNEVTFFDKLLNSPDKPFAVILGGAKVSDKIGVIKNLIPKADTIIIGGAMSYTFLKYQRHEVGTSLVEQDQLKNVEEILSQAKQRDVKILLPIDHVASKEFNGNPEYISTADIPKDFMGLDIGEKTIELYTKSLSNCKTIFWNGPMGVFENPNYSKGTFAIAKNIASLNVTVVVGGGDSVSAINKAGVANNISHISTGGGASLEYMEFGSLPGIEVLTDK